MPALVTAVLAAHFAYLAYLLLGGFLAWRWPHAIWPHLVAVGWGIAVVLGAVDCPLTWAEDWARRRAGQGPLTQGFVDRFLDGVIYPERYVNLVRAGLALVVAGSWVGAYVIWHRRRSRHPGGRHDGASPRKSEEEPGRAATV